MRSGAKVEWCEEWLVRPLVTILLQLYTAAYDGFSEGRQDKEGTFVVDALAGSRTSFKVFFPDLTESYVRSLSVSSKAAGSFTTIMDSQTSSQYLSVYDVPFDTVSPDKETKNCSEKVSLGGVLTRHIDIFPQ